MGKIPRLPRGRGRAQVSYARWLSDALTGEPPQFPDRGGSLRRLANGRRILFLQNPNQSLLHCGSWITDCNIPACWENSVGKPGTNEGSLGQSSTVSV